MKKPMTIALSAAVVGAALLTTDRAEAGCCVAYDYGNANGNKTEIIQKFESKLQEVEAAIVEALQKHAGQLTGNLKEQMLGQSQMAQLQDDREVVRRIEDARQQAFRTYASGASTCNVLTGNLVQSGAMESVQGMTVAVGDLLHAWDMGSASVDGKTPASKDGSQAAVRARLSAYQPYCDEAAKTAGVCESVVSDPKLQSASINATKSIFAANTYSGDVAMAADRFLQNAVNPTPQGPLPANYASTDAGAKLFADRMGVRARTSVAENFLAEYAGRRKALNSQVAGSGGDKVGIGNKIGIKEWSEGTAKQVIGYNSDGGNFPNGVSWTDWMELRSKAWFMNHEWLTYVDNNNESQNLKDMSIILSFIAYQNWETYKLLEKMGSVQAVQLAIMAEENRVSSIKTR